VEASSLLRRRPLLLSAVAVVAIALAAFVARRPTIASAQGADNASTRVSAAPLAGHTVAIPFADARPILATHQDLLPAALKGKAGIELEAAWPAWVSQHNADIRARLERGDEDSLVNFWLYGTSFTTLPRATERDIARLSSRDKIAELLKGRLDDLVMAIASPGANDRLRFARQVIERHTINPGTEAGRDQTRAYLVELRSRVIAENDRYRQAARSATLLPDTVEKLNAYSTMYRDRGLSSDTSLRPGFAIETTLAAMKSSGRLGAVRRIAIVGPGLDFSDKAEGYDFYPQQTIQPFGVLDSLIRLGLTRAGDVRVTTFDLSPRVNQHLESARRRAERGDPYVLQLPLDMNDPLHEWHPALVNYWRQFGDQIGVGVSPIAPPRGTEGVRVRAVQVGPAVVTSIVPRDVNIVLERTDDEPFDLIIATNVLVYYDMFEQSLALANVARMLRTGGFFLTNYAVSPLPPMEREPSLVTPVFWDRQRNGDTLFWYQRR
jgi:hypothetical protein